MLPGAIGGGGAAALGIGAKTGGLLGAGASPAGSGSGAGAATGMRGGMMMSGGGQGSEQKKKRPRSGLGGPIAPRLEDDEEPMQRSKGSRAGSRDENPEA